MDCGRSRRLVAGGLALGLCVWLGGFLCLGWSCSAAANPPPRFTEVQRRPDGWTRVGGQMGTNRLVLLESSVDLNRWTRAALIDYRALDESTWQIVSTQATFTYLDPATTGQANQYYRFSSFAAGATNDWKSQIVFGRDAFSVAQGSEAEGEIRWAKFAIVLAEPSRVYYQDGNQYVLHHDFARQRLDPFRGSSRTEFDRVSLYSTNRQVVLGTVLFPPRTGLAEYGVQFAGREPYPAADVERYFRLVASTVVAPSGTVAFYFPAFEQTEAAATDAAFFAAAGIPVSSASRWIGGDQVYASGWALGRIRQIPASQIDAAYGDGRLRPEDILLTDGVPAEVPFVAGIVSTAPATPNSHVAILANGYGIPFAYVAPGALRSQVLGLVDQEVVYQAAVQSGSALIAMWPVGTVMSPELRAELLSMKQSTTVDITPMGEMGKVSISADHVSLDDVRYVGGKAANYGIIRRTVPDSSEPAVAFTFDLWRMFLDQKLPSGRTLRKEIQTRLSAYRYPPPMTALRTDLAALRQTFTKVAGFDDGQKQAITNALAGFDPYRKIRFRSSSNAEDNRTFSAAGLYDSFSGCLADDLDADEAGPSRADASEPKEQGVFRAIQKVYASFYNDNAFLERLRHGIQEDSVGMAVLAHYSFPDESELANGVAKAELSTPRWGTPVPQAELVSQQGAVSVTNPEGNARPEIVRVDGDGNPSLFQASSLVPLGGHVMGWPADYEDLAKLLYRVFAVYPKRADGASLILEYEYKKIVPNRLVLKQVREYPTPVAATTNRYLLAEPATYWIYCSEGSDPVANHRLKGLFRLENRSLRLEWGGVLTQSLYRTLECGYRAEGTVTQAVVALGDSGQATHEARIDDRLGWVTEDTWNVGAARWRLTSILPSTATMFLPQADIRKKLRVTHAADVPTVHGDEVPTTAREEEVQWVAAPDVTALADGERIGFHNGAGLEFEIVFQEAAVSSGPPLGIDKNFWGTYPAAFSPWLHSRLTGFTREPLDLRGYYSQTATPGHKYRYEWYVFEPLAEPSLPEPQRQELREKDIRWIYVAREAWTGGSVKVLVLGEEGKFRAWP